MKVVRPTHETSTKKYSSYTAIAVARNLFFKSYIENFAEVERSENFDCKWLILAVLTFLILKTTSNIEKTQKSLFFENDSLL